jgi:hypothetical protein
MWQATLITATRFDEPRHAHKPSELSTEQHELWRRCWSRVVLVDVHHFPLWERGVHDTLRRSFPLLLSIFARYAKSGGGGGTSAADATSMGLDECVSSVACLSLREERGTRMRVGAGAAAARIPYSSVLLLIHASYSSTRVGGGCDRFHDFITDAKLETRAVSFARLTTIFSKANATTTIEAFEQRTSQRRHPQVVIT